jgi:hypothetical protein
MGKNWKNWEKNLKKSGKKFGKKLEIKIGNKFEVSQSETSEK